MRILFLVTVDCDLRCRDLNVQRESLDTLLRLFDKAGLVGHATWFLNEHDFALTEHHEAFLADILSRGDAVGVHDHFEDFRGVYEENAVRDFCGRSREAVSRRLASKGFGHALAAHRNGCLLQNETVYRVLGELGYTTLFDVWPGKVFRDRCGYPSFDNRDIPQGTQPYRHDPGNTDDYRSTTGRFVQVPVFHGGMLFFPFEAMDRWIESFGRIGAETGVLSWFFHPYELMETDIYDTRTAVSTMLAGCLAETLDRLSGGYGVTFVSADECRDEMETIASRTKRYTPLETGKAHEKP